MEAKRQKLEEEQGANLIEYVLLVSLIAFLAVISVEIFGIEVNSRLSAAASIIFGK